MNDEMTAEEFYEKIDAAWSWRIFEAHASRLLAISGKEFMKRWDAGEYVKDLDRRITQVAMLRPDRW